MTIKSLETSLYNHDIIIIMVLFYWIIKPDHKNKYLVIGEWRQPTYEIVPVDVFTH